MMKFLSIDLEKRKSFIEERDLNGQIISQKDMPTEINESIFETLERDDYEIMTSIEEKLNEQEDLEVF